MDMNNGIAAGCVAIFAIIAVIFIIRGQVEEYSRENERERECRVDEERKIQQQRQQEYLLAKRRKRRERLAELERKQQEFRKVYGLSDEAMVYSDSDFCATSPMNPTEHERRIANGIVEARFFNKYFVFLDCYFKTQNGRTGQIDVLAVGKRGVFVFESKDYNGWIFGNGNSAKWTQTFYNKKYHFYNPIKQNAGHIKVLESIIGRKPRYHSIVVFGDGAELKEVNYIPKDTYVVTNGRLLEAMRDIMKKQPECLTSAEVLEICKRINKARLFCGEDMLEKHVERIREDVTGEVRLYS